MTDIPKASPLSPDTLYDLACVMTDAQVLSLARAVKAVIDGSGYGVVSIEFTGGKPKEFGVQYSIRPVVDAVVDASKPEVQ